MSPFIIAIAVFAAGGLLALIAALAGPRAIESMPGAMANKAKIEEFKRLDEQKTQELTKIAAILQNIDAELLRQERELGFLMSRRAKFAKDQPLPLVEHGSPLLGHKLFEAYVHNLGVLRARRAGEPPPVNPFWEDLRYVIVWAPNLEAAAAELSERYPLTDAWSVDLRGEVAL